MKKIIVPICIFVAALLGACAGTPKPASELASTHAAVRAAQEVGAESNPQAQLHLVLAQEQLQKADKLMEDGDYAEAKDLLFRSKADAELAVALARRSDAQQSMESSQPSSNGPQASDSTVSMNETNGN